MAKVMVVAREVPDETKTPKTAPHAAFEPLDCMAL